MDVRYQFSTEDVNWQEVEALFKAADLGGRVGDKLRRAFEHSSVVCFAYDGARLIGASRALTDWEYHALIYDVAVHPDYQRRGIGHRMMSELLGRMPVWRTMLVAADDVKDFYRQLGFEEYKDVMARLDWNKLYDDGARIEKG